MNKGDLKNGMTLVLRNGCKVDYHKGYMLDFYSEVIMKMDNYNDDLTYNDRKCDFWDICEIIENGLVIWKREEIDWSKVHFGTKVVCWNDINNKFEGKFLGYDDGTNKYIVFVSVDRRIDWECCELVEEPKEEVTAKKLNYEYLQHCTQYDINCEGCDYEYIPHKECMWDWISDNYNVTRK